MKYLYLDDAQLECVRDLVEDKIEKITRLLPDTGNARIQKRTLFSVLSALDDSEIIHDYLVLKQRGDGWELYTNDGIQLLAIRNNTVDKQLELTYFSYACYAVHITKSDVFSVTLDGDNVIIINPYSTIMSRTGAV